MTQVGPRTAVIDGVHTAYLDAGESAPARPPVLLLHGGTWGECAEASWSATIGPLSQQARVIAPDWLGFGGSGKVRNFVDTQGHLLRQLGGLLDALGVDEVDVVGLSMGGSVLLRDLASPAPVLAVRRAVLVSAGGPPTSGPARAAMMDYDGTLESMRRQVALAFADPAWAADDDFVARRHAWSLLPGAYEWFASLGVRAPGAPPPPPGADSVPYEAIDLPVLVTAGARDQLKPGGYADHVARRLPQGRLHVFPEAGHCPQLESAEEWNSVVTEFLAAPTPLAAPTAQAAPTDRYEHAAASTRRPE